MQQIYVQFCFDLQINVLLLSSDTLQELLFIVIPSEFRASLLWMLSSLFMLHFIYYVTRGKTNKFTNPLIAITNIWENFVKPLFIREGGDIRLFITLVPKVLNYFFLFVVSTILWTLIGF